MQGWLPLTYTENIIENSEIQNWGILAHSGEAGTRRICIWWEFVTDDVFSFHLQWDQLISELDWPIWPAHCSCSIRLQCYDCQWLNLNQSKKGRRWPETKQSGVLMIDSTAASWRGGTSVGTNQATWGLAQRSGDQLNHQFSLWSKSFRMVERLMSRHRGVSKSTSKWTNQTYEYDIFYWNWRLSKGAPNKLSMTFLKHG